MAFTAFNQTPMKYLIMLIEGIISTQGEFGRLPCGGEIF
jgi:hypothetical protein